jgi:hypothetical protein
VREHIVGSLLTEERIAELFRQYGESGPSVRR